MNALVVQTFATEIRTGPQIVAATANLESLVRHIGNLGSGGGAPSSGLAKRQDKTADALMASATAVAGREFY